MTTPPADPSDTPEPEPQPAPEPAPSPGPARHPHSWKKRIKRGLLIALISPLVALTLYTLVMYNWAYSQGDRSGILRKFSKKGWICKTWEGELALTTVPGVMPELWAFTVRDDSVARLVTSALGREVVLHYSEHRGLWSDCFGETSYFIDSVRVIGQP
jgi:hypothetical protein